MVDDQRAEVTILKANFPENSFCYVNQGSLLLVKGCEKAIYLDFVILGQLMPAAKLILQMIGKGFTAMVTTRKRVPYFKLIREFRHMSLFLICLHFLRCTRSCDRKSNYCRVCTRVREKFFFECNAFSSLCVCACGTYLHKNNSHRTNLDVVLLNAQQNLESYTEDNGNCSFFLSFYVFTRVVCCFFCITR